jgi:hypothetical protein
MNEEEEVLVLSSHKICMWYLLIPYYYHVVLADTCQTSPQINA